VSYPPVKAGHLLIDGATLASVIGKKLSVFSAMQNVDNGPSRHFAATQHFVAFAAKRTLSEPRLRNAMYEYMP
jgi:hypothetical protein